MPAEDDEEDEDEEMLVHVGVISDYISDPEMDGGLSDVGEQSQCADKQQESKAALQTDAPGSATKTTESVSISSTSEDEAEVEKVEVKKAEVEKAEVEKTEVEKAEVEKTVPVHPAAS